MDKIKNNPVLSAATIGSMVSALLALLIAFGVPILPNQVEAILLFVGVVAPVVLSAIYARSKVEGPKTRERKERQFYGH